MDFVQHKFSHIANELQKKEDVENEKYRKTRDRKRLISNGSRKILNTKLKSTIINQDPNKAMKMAKVFDTPVHERLFIDSMNRQKRIEEIKSFHEDFASDEPRIMHITSSK